MDINLIKGPVGRVLALIVWLVVFSLIVGSVNGWYLQSVDSGVVSGERFDRVVLKASTDSNADDRWQKVTSAGSAFSHTAASTKFTPSNTTAYKLAKETVSGVDKCKIGTITGAASGKGMDASTWFTPLGTEVTSAAIADADVDASGESANAFISDCEWSEAGAVFNAGGLGGLVEIILQAAGLAAPLALLFALGSFGTSFMRNMGSHPILAAVVMVILLLLVATLLNTFVPFLTDAFEAIDKNRFQMFDEGLGSLSVVIGNFYGVVVVASMMMVAWQVVKHIRGEGNVIDAADRM